MNPITSPLKLSDAGPSVVNLQDALLFLVNKDALAVDAASKAKLLRGLASERNGQVFGDGGTLQLVRLFQAQQRLPDTGQVDDPTAGKLNELLQYDMEWHVAGSVRDSSGVLQPKTRILIFASKDTQPLPDPAAELMTDAKGMFDWIFVPARQSWKDAASLPELFAQAMSGDNRVLGQSGSEKLQALQFTTRLDVVFEAVTDHPNQYFVEGYVRGPAGKDSPGLGVSGVRVRAFDQDVLAANPLGEAATTDDSGYYRINFVEEEFLPGDADENLRPALPAMFSNIKPAKRPSSLAVGPDVWVGIPATTDIDSREFMARSEIRYNAGRQTRIDLTLASPEHSADSELEELVRRVLPRLQGLPVGNLVDWQISFLSQDADLPQDQMQALAGGVRMLEQARTLAATQSVVFGDLEAALLDACYAFSRAKPGIDLSALLDRNRSSWSDTITAAIGAHRIPGEVGAYLEPSLDFLNRLRLFRSLLPAAPNALPSLGDLLTVAVDAGKQEPIAKLFSEHEGATDAFWKALAGDNNVKPADVAAVKQTLALGTFTDDHLPLVRALYQMGKDKAALADLQGLAQLDESDWQKILRGPRDAGDPNSQPIGFPSGQESIESYARTLNQSIETSFPMAVISNRLERDNSAESPFKETKPDLLVFFANNPGFSFAGTPPDSYLSGDASEKLREIKNPGILRTQLKSMQRVFNITPRFAGMRALLADDMHSATAITHFGRRRFAEKYSDALGGEGEARNVYDSAEHIHATALNVYMKHAGAFNSPMPYVISGDGPEIQPVPGGTPSSDGPDLSTLFGSINLCDCPHCQSLYSPAAYLTDILKFLADGPTKDGMNPLRALLARRPDIEHIELTCDNTNLELPYVDLTNEILETAITPRSFMVEEALGSSKVLTALNADEIHPLLKTAFASNGYALSDQASLRIEQIAGSETNSQWLLLDAGWAFVLSPQESDHGFRMLVAAWPQTSWTPEELGANPEHSHAQAYAVLQSAVYPWNLPLNLPLEEMRAYLGHLGVPRHELIEALVSGATFDQDIALEYLGLAKEEAAIITGVTTGGPAGTPVPVGAWNFWGLLDTGNDLVDPMDGTASHAQGRWDVVLRRVSVFLQQSGLSYRELLELLGTYYVNPVASSGRTIGIVSIDPEDPTTCNPSKLEMQVDAHVLPGDTTVVRKEKLIAAKDKLIAAWSRAHRFVRLWRKLGWTMRDLDKATTAQPKDNRGEIVDADSFLKKLSDIQRLHVQTRLPVVNLLSWWADIDTGTYVDHLVEGEPAVASLYAQLFGNKTVAGQIVGANPLSLGGTLSGKAAAVAAALQTSMGDFALLQAAIPNDGALTLSNLSLLYRHATFAKALQLPIDAYLVALGLVGIAPFATTTDTIQFIKKIDKIRASAFSIEDLDYLLRHKFSTASHFAATDDAFVTVLDAIRGDLRKISAENTFVEAGPGENAATSDPTGELSGKKLALLNWTPTLIESVIAALNGKFTFETELPALGTGVILPESLRARISYSSTEGKLRFTGTMTAAEQALLVSLPNTDATFATAVGKLFQAPQLFLSRYVAEFAIRIFSVPIPDANLRIYLRQVKFPDALKDKVYYDPAAETLHFVGVMTEAQRTTLLALSPDAHYADAIGALFSAPTTIQLPPAEVFLTNLGAASDVSTVVNVPDDKREVRFLFVLKKLLHYLKTTLSEIAVKQRLGEYLKLDPTVIEGLLKKWIKRPPADLSHPERVAMADFLEPAFAESNPNVRSSKEAFPRQFASLLLLYKIAVLSQKFKITSRQLPWLFEPTLNPGWLDLNALPLSATVTAGSSFQGWERLVDLFQLCDTLPNGEALLADIFTTATTPGTQLDDVLEVISEGTQWELRSLKALSQPTGFDFHVSSFAGEAAMLRLSIAMTMLGRLGASADQCLAWAKLSPTGDHAYELRSLIRAKYDDAQWLNVAKRLRDPLRERQRSASVAYLLQKLGARNADDLHDRFLIDVEMSPCMTTTRIKQAIGSVQLFIQRCLMNLERDVSLTPKEAQEWAQWRKWYRVWEANRKVLFYPENWIEPELRDDKSPFFQDLENELLQNDVTTDTAEDTFLNYLEKLDRVARLEIVGMYRQQEAGDVSQQLEAIDILHVFGRTYAIPHHYFYRRLEAGVWSAWEKVELDIEGDHLIPVEWNRRLHLFWPVFTEKSEQPTKDQRAKDEDPNQYWEIKFACSEYRNNGWSPKNVSKDWLRYDKYPHSPTDVPQVPPLDVPQKPQDFSFKTRILQGPFGDQLGIDCYGTTVHQGDPTSVLTVAGSPAIVVNRQLIASIGPKEVADAGLGGVPLWYVNVGFYMGTSRPTPVEALKISVEFRSHDQNLFLETSRVLADGVAYLTNATDKAVDCYLVSPAYADAEVPKTFFNGYSASREIAVGVNIYLIPWSPTPATANQYELVYPGLSVAAMRGIGKFTLDDCNGELVAVPVSPASLIQSPQLLPIPATKFEGMSMVDLDTQEFMRSTDLLAKTPGTYRLLGMHQRYAAGYIGSPFFYQDDSSVYFVADVLQPTNKLLFDSFYHPRVGSFIRALSHSGIKGLLTLTNQRLITGDHFYTTATAERDNAISQYGYRSEGIACYLFAAPDSDKIPFYRLLSTRTGDHFYTTDIVERNSAITLDGYQDENVAGYVYEYYVSGAVPLYRLLHPQVGDHFYTTDIGERDTAITLGYRSEKIACHVFNFPLAGTTPLYRSINAQIVFERKYQPGALVGQPRPVEDVNFEHGGAYSLYNWELFFHAPFLIAAQLSRNQRFEDAQKWFHYIFDPTATDSPDRPGNPGPERFWRMKPFYDAALQPVQTLEALIKGTAEMDEEITAWQANPFKPHVIARLRVVAYMKATVMRYIDNLIAWGDQLFRGDTIESINEATQLYLLAARTLGRRPESIPARAKVKIHTFRTLDDVEMLDGLANAMVEIEGFLPPSVAPVSTGGMRAGVPLIMPIFCIPGNDKLLGYWDTVSDRLFKIRHCMNIEGVERSLPIFEPPIDPALLVRAAAAGVDIASALNDLNAAVPHYRFNVMVQKASELCNDVKALGGAFLAALEKRDAEALALLRSSHEVELLKAIREIKAQQTSEANNTLQGLMKYCDVVTARQQYYMSRPFMNAFEISHIALAAGSLIPMAVQIGAEATAAVGHALPNAKIAAPTSAGTTSGGENVGNAAQAFSRGAGTVASMLNTMGSLSATLGGYERRQDDWTHQADLATKELRQLEKQIAAAEIRLAISEHELENHDLQIENAQEVDEYMRAQKFTNQELYNWMVGQLSGIYFQSYQLAYDGAKRAERAYRYELGLEDSNFIKFGYWDSLKKGLLSGEKLHLDLKRLDVAYLDQNKREFELTKHVSLRKLNPLALLQLKLTGTCQITVPEWLFDLDCPGHYFRRLRNVGVSVPAVAGPYTNVHCSLSLLESWVRISTGGPTDTYERAGFDDSRFAHASPAVSSIVTSTGSNDTGLFETNLRDERFLPFEGAGAESTWKLELPTDFPQFDYQTIADVILHLRYTARSAPLLKSKAIARVQTLAAQKGQLALLFSLRHDFPTEWSAFVNGTAPFTATIRKDFFPYFTQEKTIHISGFEVYGSDPAIRHSIGDPVDLTAAQPTTIIVAVEDPPTPKIMARTSGAQVVLIVRYGIS